MHILNIVGDIVVIAVMAMAVYGAYQAGSIAVFILVIILLFACYRAFTNTGGFAAWTARGRKEFEDGFDAIKNNDDKSKD